MRQTVGWGLAMTQAKENILVAPPSLSPSLRLHQSRAPCTLICSTITICLHLLTGAKKAIEVYWFVFLLLKFYDLIIKSMSYINVGSD